MEHSDDFYSMSAEKKLDVLYRLTLQNTNETQRIAKALDPLSLKTRVLLLAAGSTLGGFLAHLVLFAGIIDLLR